jgi:hypothetical protein
MESEGLEISQPALDPRSSEIHHRITRRHPRQIVHKYAYKFPCLMWIVVHLIRVLVSIAIQSMVRFVKTMFFIAPKL